MINAQTARKLGESLSAFKNQASPILEKFFDNVKSNADVFKYVVMEVSQNEVNDQIYGNRFYDIKNLEGLAKYIANELIRYGYKITLTVNSREIYGGFDREFEHTMIMYAEW